MVRNKYKVKLKIVCCPKKDVHIAIPTVLACTTDPAIP